jgi:histone H3/H4
MNAAILDLIIKGVESLPALVEAGVSIYNRVQQIKDLAKSAKAGTVTHEDIVRIRAQFDAELDDFNQPI